ncbi:hypothetical protein AB0N05_37700 [Nocardia sp. NPDC051030]|uniref:hypothetical protein n=1 Tax=Nocardia sp. NPDC051030 TaxID=3155162 RepID=UPI003446CA47
MRTPLKLAIALAATVMITGCGSETTNNTAVIGGESSSSAKTSSNNANPQQAASEQAIALVNRYFQTISRLDADPTVTINAVDDVAAGQALTTAKADVTTRRSQGIVITGEIKVVDAKAAEVRLDAKPASVQVHACLDISTRDAKFPDGSSANAANRNPRVSSQLTVENPSWPDSRGWRVVADTGKRGGEACEKA